MSGTKRYTPYIEEQKKIQQLKLNHYKTALNAVDPHPIPSIDVVTLPEWDTMSDDEKVADARWLCAAAEKKMDVQPPHIARKVAERIGCGASTYGNYRRGLCVLRSNYQRHGYRYVRDVLSHYLNTGEWKRTELPALTARQIEYNGAYKEKNAAAEKRLADIEDRITANNTQFKSWKTRTGNAYDTTNGKLQGAVAEQHDQRVRLNKAISEGVRLDKRIDFVDKAGNRSFDRQDVEIIKLHQRLDGLAEANKLLLQKLEATTEPAPPTELAQWWDRWWSR